MPDGMLLLDFVRYHQHLTGTKIGCREGDCGACSVLIGEIVNNQLRYRSATSCLTALGNVHAKHVVTIEGINFLTGLNLVQQEMYNESATQCGFCTPGFIMSLTCFCLSDNQPSLENAIAAIDGNICRCTGYKSIERATQKIVDALQQRQNDGCIPFAVKQQIVPAYFELIENQLKEIVFSERKKTQKLTPVKFLGGGTDLYVQKHDEMEHASIDLVAANPALKAITLEGDKCYIGAAVTVTDLAESPVFQAAFPAYKQYIKLVSSTPIRNIATIAGNFINASPIGDFTIFFLALDAQLILSDGISNRTIPLRQLYKGYKLLNKSSEEYIEKIYFKVPDAQSIFHFEKVCKRTHLDIASVNTAIVLKLDGNRIIEASLSAGGVAPIPAFLVRASAYLQGKTISEGLVNETIALVQQEISPISDSRGSAEYKRLLLGQLIKAHFIEAVKNIQS